MIGRQPTESEIAALQEVTLEECRLLGEAYDAACKLVSVLNRAPDLETAGWAVIATQLHLTAEDIGKRLT